MKKREMKTHITVDDVREYDTSPFFQKKYFSDMFPDGCDCSPESILYILDDLCWGKLHRVEAITGINTWLPPDQYRVWRKSLMTVDAQLSKLKRSLYAQICCIKKAIYQNVRASEIAKKQAVSERHQCIESQLTPLREDRDRKIAEIRAAYDAKRKELVDVYDREHPQTSFPPVDNAELEIRLSDLMDEYRGYDSEQHDAKLRLFQDLFAAANAYNEVQP
jgi:hypothetical protein